MSKADRSGAQSSLSYAEVDTRAPTPLDRGCSATPGLSAGWTTPGPSEFSRAQTPAGHLGQATWGGQTEDTTLDISKLPIPPGKRPATGPPAKIGAPKVLPHNTWCIFVEWVPPADENSIISYRLELMTDDASKPMLLDELGTVPRAQFEDLDGGKRYYFRVRSVNEFGQGPWSDWSEGFLMPEFSSTNAPESSSDGADSIELSWIAPCDHGAPLIGYRIQYALDPQDTRNIQTVVVMNGKQVSNRINGLQSNMIYYFRSRAINEIGESNWTDWTDGIATKALAPEAPRPPRKKATSTRELTIAWEPPKSFGIPVLYYQVRVACEDETMESAVGVPTAATKQEQARYDKTDLRITGLEPNRKYYFQIAAANQIGMSPWSQTSGPISTAWSPPAKCGKVWHERSSCRSITVQWEAPECYRLPIDDYLLRWSNFPMMMDAELCVVKATPETSETGALCRHTLTGVLPGTRMYFEVAARNKAGSGEWSICSEGIHTYPDVPGPPSAPTCNERTATTFVVAFEAPDDQGDEIEGFQLQMDTSASMMDAEDCVGVMHQIKLVPGKKNYEYVVGGLGNHNWYYFRFRAWNNVGMSAWSPISKPFRVKTERPCKMAAPFCVSSESVHSLVIGFTPSADSGIINGGNIAGYELRYSLSAELLKENTPADTGIDNHGVSSGEDDNEIAMFLDGKRNKDEGGQLYAPTSAKGIVVVKPPREEYAKNRVMLLRSSPIRIEGLKSGSEYYLQVRAVGDYGEGPWSDVSLPISTQPSRPDAPVPIVQVQQSAFSMVLNLILPEANGRPITYCKLKRLGPNWPNLQVSKEWNELDLIEAEDVKVIETKTVQPLDQGGLVKTDTIWQLNMLSLAPGASYQLVACYTNTVGTSEWSETTEPFFCEPIVPERVNLPYINDNELTPYSMKIHWSRPHDNGSEIKHYTLMWSDNKNFSPCTTIEPITEVSYDITGLLPKRGYYIKVAAVNAVGQGKFSEVDPKRNHGYFRTLATVPGVVPRIGLAEKPSHRSVMLTWGVPNDDGGAKLIRFKIRYSRTNRFDQIEDEEIFEGTARRRGVHNLEPETMYFFQVAAGNNVGFGEYDAIVGPVKTAKATLTMVKPPRPDKPTAVQSTSRSITIKWKCPELFDPKFGFIQSDTQTHPLSHYHLRISTDPNFKRQKSDFLLYHYDFPQERDRRTVPKEDKNEHTFEGLLPGRVYYAAVQAKNVAGLSEYGPPSFEIETQCEVPAPCFGFQCVEVRPDAIVMQWPLPDTNGLEIKGFLLRYGIEAELASDALEKKTPIDVPVSSLPTRGTPVRYELTGLQPGMFYFIEVACYNDLGAGKFSRSRPFRTESLAPSTPHAVKGVTEEKSQTGVTVKWETPDDGGEMILGFQIRYASRRYQVTSTGDPHGPDGKQLDLPADSNSFRIDNLNPGDCANAVVRCNNCKGWSDWSECPSEAIIATDLCTLASEPDQVSIPPWFTEGPPTTHRPYNLVINCTCPCGKGRPTNAFRIKFMRVNGSEQSFEREIIVAKESDDDFEWSEGKPFSYDTQDLGLEAGVQYLAEVKAINDIGECKIWSPPSEPGRCPPDYPGRPDPPDSAWQWPTRIELEWICPKTNGSPIEAYDLRFSKNPDILSDPMEVTAEELAASLESCALSVGGLTETQKYYFQIRALNGIGWSDWSDVSDGFLTKASRPARPGDLDPAVIEPRSITVKWNPPKDHGSPIDTYELILAEGKLSERLVKLTDGANECTTAEGRRSSINSKQEQLLFFRLEEVDLKKTPCEYTFGDLAPGIFYSMSLRAYNGEGPGDWSPVLLNVRTLSTAPEKCEQLQMTEATSSSLSMKYVYPHHNGEMIDGLRFRWCRMRGPTDRFKSGQRISGVNQMDWSSVPMDVRPTDIMTIIDVPNTPTFEVLDGSFTVENLEPGADYEIQVAVRNMHGYGPFAKPQMMQCLPGVPDAPTRMHNAGTACVGESGTSAVLFKRSKTRSSVMAVQAGNFMGRMGLGGSSSSRKVAPMPEEQE